MKLLLVFAFLAIVAMTQTAPTSSSTTRQLILPDYHDDEDTGFGSKPSHTNDQLNDDDENEEDTTTTTTTRRWNIGFPTRNRNLIPSRRPFVTESTSSVRTTTRTSVFDEENEQSETNSNYDGDYRHIRDFGKYIRKLIEDIKKIIRNITSYDISSFIKQQKQRFYDGDDDE